MSRAFFDSIVRVHGIPCSIVSNRDTIFTFAFWKDLFRLAGVTLNMTSAFHLRVMASLRLRIALLLCISGAWQEIVHVPGFNGCLGLSIVTTLRIRPLFIALRSGWYMVGLVCLIVLRAPRGQGGCSGSVAAGGRSILGGDQGSVVTCSECHEVHAGYGSP